jgi:hypothetical protein
VLEYHRPAEGNEKMPSEPVTDADVKKLDELIDRYGITELVRTLSMLCDQRSEDLTQDESSEELWTENATVLNSIVDELIEP